MTTRKEIDAAYYQANKLKVIERNKLNRERLKQLADELKNNPCQDCDIVYPPYVMEWDHRPGTIKTANISDLVRYGRKKQMLEEIKKCDLVCANCHRIRTFNR